MDPIPLDGKDGLTLVLGPGKNRTFLAGTFHGTEPLYLFHLIEPWRNQDRFRIEFILEAWILLA
jgi:hypothetical protein